MHSAEYALRHLSDGDLVDRLHRMVQRKNELSAELLAHIAEADARRLYAKHATNSMFEYCTRRLGLSESEAYRRINAARAARKFPVIFEMVSKGEIHLTGVVVLAPHLTEETHRELLLDVRKKTKREIEGMLAERFPQPDVRTSIRRLPNPAPFVLKSAGSAQGPAPEIANAALPLMQGVALVQAVVAANDAQGAPPLALDAESTTAREPAPPCPAVPRSEARVTPLAPARYKVVFTASPRRRP